MKRGEKGDAVCSAGAVEFPFWAGGAGGGVDFDVVGAGISNHHGGGRDLAGVPHGVLRGVVAGIARKGDYLT